MGASPPHVTVKRQPLSQWSNAPVGASSRFRGTPLRNRRAAAHGRVACPCVPLPRLAFPNACYRGQLWDGAVGGGNGALGWTCGAGTRAPLQRRSTAEGLMHARVRNELLQTYPVVLRRSYRSVLEATNDVLRHKLLLRLADAGLRVVASVALTEAAGAGPGVVLAERATRPRSPSMGKLIDVVRACVQRGSEVAPTEAEMFEPLPASGRLGLAMSAIQDSIELRAGNIERLIIDKLRQVPPTTDWLEAWGLIVKYRNRAEGHPDSYDWPIDHDDYFRLFTPILEEAVTELLLTPHLRRVFSTFILADLRRVDFDNGAFVHTFLCDDHGVPVTTAIVLDRSLGPARHADGTRAPTFVLMKCSRDAYQFVAPLCDVAAENTHGTDQVPMNSKSNDAAGPIGSARQETVEEAAGIVVAPEQMSAMTFDGVPVVEGVPESDPLFAIVEPGKFVANPGTRASIEVRLRHRLVVARYPVRQSEYFEIAGARPSRHQGDSMPVDSISWYDAVSFCNQRSARDNLVPVYHIEGRRVDTDFSASGYRLLTEAEWEYCCRAGEVAEPDSAQLKTVAWFVTYSDATTHEAGSLDPNGFGLYDMRGNVREWCNDWYSGKYPSGPVDPSGPIDGIEKVIRGGSAIDLHQCLSASYRQHRADPKTCNEFLGFRIARRLNDNADSTLARRTLDG